MQVSETAIKVLLIRLDKIGDLISTMCVDQSGLLMDCEVQWVIAKGLGFIPDHSEPKRKYLELAKSDWRSSLNQLISFIRNYKPDIAVSFQAPWWVGYALWKENVPVRTGVLSQWHSFLFLNKGLRQKRSQALQHEADYNFDLLKFALEDLPRPSKNSILANKNTRESQSIHHKILPTATSQLTTPILKLVAPENPQLLLKCKLTAKNYVTIHPGMAGSALNWPSKNYIELIEKLVQKNQVVLTGTAADEPFLKDIKEHFKLELEQASPRLINLQGLLTMPELFTILKNSKAVVAPSTGVAHMAASLGVKTLGLYSPIRVQHPRRWAARGNFVKIFVSANENPPYDHAMEEIKVDDVLAEIFHNT